MLTIVSNLKQAYCLVSNGEQPSLQGCRILAIADGLLISGLF